MKTTFKCILAVASFVASSFVAQAQVKIGTNATLPSPTSNLEVEASTPARKVKVDKVTGQVTIQDGTEGTGKVLTSDAVGGASWQTTTTLRIPETVWIGEQAATAYTITNFTGIFDELKDRIPLSPRTGSLPGYNATTKQYTIQADGYYRIHSGAAIIGTLGGTQNTLTRLYLSPSGVLHQYDNINSASAPRLSIFWEGFMTAGTLVDTYVISSYSVASPPQNLLVTMAFLSITKLF